MAKFRVRFQHRIAALSKAHQLARQVLRTLAPDRQ
jgi:hypothetical protein